jgi:hypothetical protein
MNIFDAVVCTDDRAHIVRDLSVEQRELRP